MTILVNNRAEALVTLNRDEPWEEPLTLTKGGSPINFDVTAAAVCTIQTDFGSSSTVEETVTTNIVSGAIVLSLTKTQVNALVDSYAGTETQTRRVKIGWITCWANLPASEGGDRKRVLNGQVFGSRGREA